MNRFKFWRVGAVIAAAACVASLLSSQLSAGEKKASKKAREADVKEIERNAREFEAAFAKKEAKKIAAMWTVNGEYEDESGLVIQGRDQIEKAFGEHFKTKDKGKLEILIEAIRFPAPDLAIEEGLVRTSDSADDVPQTTAYSVTHVREGGQWKIAASREWGAGVHRLEDLEWLIGAWKGVVKDQQVTLTFTKVKGKPFIFGEFVRKEKGKTHTSGTIKIGIDPGRRQLRSWHFDDDGGHGQALWLRDGKRWVLDTQAVLADGTEAESLNILGRVDADALIWRSIDRVAGDEPLPDTAPLKLSRVK